VTQVQKMFDKYDLDKDCRLSRSEFRAVLVSCGLRDADARAIYAKVDVNKDATVDMKEFVKWLYSETPDMDTDKEEVAKDRMGKVHRHMKRGSMNQAEAMEDFFDFMGEMKEQYKFATKRDVIVLEDNIQSSQKKDGSMVAETTREVKLRDFFNNLDLNGNGKVTMSEFVRGMKSLGHDGDQDMVAGIFRAIDQAKSRNRVWDRKYHKYKKQEDDAAAEGKTSYLVPACEIFEKRDMRKWNEDRAEAINDAMEAEKESLSEIRENRKEKKKEMRQLEVSIKKQEDAIAAKKFANNEQDKIDNDALRDAMRELNAVENQIAAFTNQLHEARFHYTETTYKDGMLDWKEFNKAFTDAGAA